jgi:CubicO group peptidase (beta-lactamase class C family)
LTFQTTPSTSHSKQSRARSESLPVSERLAADLRHLVAAQQSERRLPSVSAAVFRGDKLLWAEAIGLAEIESAHEATPDTQYRIGSITKIFTAVAIMQLRDAGDLELEDSLQAHVPEAEHAGPTIRRMLAHVSGLQREPPGEVWETLEDPTIEELLGRLGDVERVLPPGAYWHYSNLAYALLGEIVARRVGKPAAAYIDERIIEPLGLTRTTWAPNEPAATGYFVDPYSDAVTPEVAVELRGSAPIGQLWSTTGDLARWGAFLTEGDAAVLEGKTVEEMHAFQSLVPYVKGWKRGWGLGLELVRDGDRILAGHGGAMPGFLASLVVSREDKTGAVALTNSSASAYMDQLSLALARTTLEQLPPQPEGWEPAEPPPAEIAGLLGRWWSEGHEFVFRIRHGKIEATLADTVAELEPTVFEPDGPDRFRAISGLERGELLRIVRDESGEAVKLYWATYPFTRAPRVFGS